MASFPISLLFIGTTLVLLSTNTHALSDPQAMCKGINDTQFCDQLMQTVRANTPADALKTIIEITLKKTIEGQTMFEKLAGQTMFEKLAATAKPEEKDAFGKCKNFYEGAVYDLEKSLENIEIKDRRIFHIYLSSTLVYYDACNNVSSRGGPGGWVAPPADVAKVNTPLQKLIKNVLFATRFEL